MIAIVIGIILIVGSTRELTKYGYEVPCEINTTLIASSGNWTGVVIPEFIRNQKIKPLDSEKL